MTKTSAILYLITALFFISSLNSSAGWIITEVIHDPSGNSIARNTTYIQDNFIKCVEESHSVIFDLDNRKIMFINPSLGFYWKGTTDQYARKVKEIALQYFKKEIENAPPEERAYYEAIYDNLKIELEQESDAVVFHPDVNIEIVMMDESESLLGYEARKYKVYQNGFLREELWLTPEIPINADFNAEKFRTLINEMAWGVMNTDHQAAPEYIHLMKTGLVLRSVEYLDDGTFFCSEVLDVVREDIPPEMFSPPEGYKKVGLGDLGLIN